MPNFDVIVVGSGPAGATAAIKCSRHGLNVLLVEKGPPYRHKPCGGVLPPVCGDLIEETVGKRLPSSVMSVPDSLGLCYVPPSGRSNGGTLKNYRLLNVNRDLFDQWLRSLAEGEGARIMYNTSLIEFKQSEPIRVVLINKKGDPIKAATRYLIGADGAFSRVSRRLYKSMSSTLHVYQEHLRAEGDLEDCFYAFFREAISPTYGYLIPKDSFYVVGLGASPHNSTNILGHVKRFKRWLVDEFAFSEISLMKKEAWSVPFGSVRAGVGNTILVGDAAGLCNPLSGEGVRFAMASGEAAGDAVEEVLGSGDDLSALYSGHIEQLARIVQRTHKFASNLSDEGREEFVENELNRITLS